MPSDAMERAVSVQYLVDLLTRSQSKSMAEIMREDEVAAGRRIILPGDTSWLPASDWPHDVVVSQDGREVRIIAIYARQPGQGAFRRMVDGIIAAGLVPVVIAPSQEMRATLKRWHWRCRYAGAGVHEEEQWRPRKGVPHV